MTTRDLTHIALFAAVTAALGLLPPLMLPLLGVPITAQSMGPMLAGAVLGARRGGLAMALFILLVALGFPVLSGGRGGLGILMGPGGGFLLAYPAAGYVVGLLCARAARPLRFFPALGGILIGGIVLLYLAGIPWIAAVAGIGLSKAAVGSAWFLPGDLVKAIVAASIAVTVRRAVPLDEISRA
jgi:biotin transport system substrate-specific component